MIHRQDGKCYMVHPHIVRLDAHACHILSVRVCEAEALREDGVQSQGRVSLMHDVTLY